MNVLLRKISPEDALISWKWRNDPDIWKLTGRKWEGNVDLNIERKWIEQVINDPTRITFSIVAGTDFEYIGNVQITNINTNNARFHIFIGNKNYWRKGIGSEATRLFIEYVKKNLNIKSIYLFVNKTNVAALKIYRNVGFIEDSANYYQIKMSLYLNND